MKEKEIEFPMGTTFFGKVKDLFIFLTMKSLSGTDYEKKLRIAQEGFDISESWSSLAPVREYLSHNIVSLSIEDIKFTKESVRIIETLFVDFYEKFQKAIILSEKQVRLKYMNIVITDYNDCDTILPISIREFIEYKVFIDDKEDFPIQDTLLYMRIIWEQLGNCVKNEPIKETYAENMALNENKTETKVEPTLKELALYYYYLGTEVTKEKQEDLLKDYKHKSGAKLKQHYDYFNKTTNRIGHDTARKNNYRVKELEHVIAMLKATNNASSIKKAMDEYDTFKKKLE